MADLRSRVKYSSEISLVGEARGGDTDAFSYILAELGRQPVCGLPQLERRSVDRELELARQRLERQRSVAQPSQLSRCLETSLRRGFYFFEGSILPAADHAADFIQSFAEDDIFLVVECFCFPCHAQHEFEEVKAGDEFFEVGKFSFFWLVACCEGEFNTFEKERIYFGAQRVFGFLWEMFGIFSPDLVTYY